MKKLLILTATLIICNAYGEDVYWVNGDSLHSTTTCTSGNNITKPTNPTKSGYRFIGWRKATTAEYKPVVRAKLATNGTASTPATQTGVTPWTTTFSWGTVSGIARCSSVEGTLCYDDATGKTCTLDSNPSTSGTTYCWCKLTDAGPLSDFVDVSSLKWMYANPVNCTASCGSNCGWYIKNYAGMRKALFGVAGQ